MELKNRTIAVIGLGYVGLPLAIEYGKKYRVIGFDIFKARVEELERGEDHTLEADLVGMKQARELFKSTGKIGLSFTSNPEELKQVNTYIVTVPTPIDRFNNPDLTPLIKASETIGKTLNKGDIVIYESTVYPAAQKKTAYLYSRKTVDSNSTKTSSADIARNVSIPAIKSIHSLKSKKSLQVQHRK